MSQASPPPTDPPDLTQLLAMIDDLRQHNETLQDNVQALQLKSLDEAEEQEAEPLEPQPLSQAIWEDAFPDNFKPPVLASYDGKTDPQEHIIAVNNTMALIGEADSLKCKLMADTFRESALRWYMGLPRFSVVSYQDFNRKIIQQFSANRYRKVANTSLFNVRQRPSESLRDFMARFNEETIKVSHPNQEIFMAAFQHGLKAGQFNKSLAQKPTKSMDEIITRAECYVKGEESNMDKRARDSKEKGKGRDDRVDQKSRSGDQPATRERV